MQGALLLVGFYDKDHDAGKTGPTLCTFSMCVSQRIAVACEIAALSVLCVLAETLLKAVGAWEKGSLWS